MLNGLHAANINCLWQCFDKRSLIAEVENVNTREICIFWMLRVKEWYYASDKKSWKGGVAFSKHVRSWGTKENWQVLYGSMHMDEIVVITGKTKYYQCIKSYEGHNGSMNLCWMQHIVAIFHFKMSKLPSTPSMKCETWS